MKPIDEIAPGIHYVGVNDRTKQRFEGLWPLPLGVSYNSYLVVDERVALIDTVDAPFADLLLDQIADAIGEREVDYLLVNHMEPDHSASIRALRQRYPGVQIVGNAKTLQMVQGYYGLCDGLREVREGERLELGRYSFVFHMTPMVHWPETMMSYCEQAQALFSGDAFGCFGALEGGILDTQMDTDRYRDEMIRYYANIVGKYGGPVQKALSKLEGVPLSLVCPTHGPVWSVRIPEVVALYDRLSRYEGETGAVIAYGSMYGNTERMAETVARQLAACGVKRIVVHNLSYSDLSYVLRDIFRYNTLIVGSPTYNGELFPEVERLTRAVASRCIPSRIFGCFGSYTWAGTAVRKLTAWAEEMKWECAAEPIEFKQGCSAAKLAPCAEFARRIAAKM